MYRIIEDAGLMQIMFALFLCLDYPKEKLRVDCRS
jgi:hypothetical protein